MPTVTLKDGRKIRVPPHKRLVLALEDGGVDILHRCGGVAECTSCRVVFRSGEPDEMTIAERDRLRENLLLGKARLSCQITCTHDMTVEPVYRLSKSQYDSPGERPEEQVTPTPVWTRRPAAV